MKNTNRTHLLLILAVIAMASSVANAVCIDPKSGISGYSVPLQDEIDSSIAIVIADVIAEKKVFEEPDDPEYYSVIYTVRTNEVLKGNPLKTFKLREELDSGRYAMSAGERHLLLITKWRWKVRGADYVIDACGNSTRLPDGDKIVDEVRDALRVGSHAP